MVSLSKMGSCSFTYTTHLLLLRSRIKEQSAECEQISKFYEFSNSVIPLTKIIIAID